MACISILDAIVVNEYINLFKKKKYMDNLLYILFISFGALVWLGWSLNYIKRLEKHYKDFFKLSKDNKIVIIPNTNSDEHTQRMLYIVNKIPHKTISSVSQFPLLFLSSQQYPANFFIEDLTAAANLNIHKLFRLQLDYLKNPGVDILASKTTLE